MTEEIFHRNSYVQSCDANVVSVSDGEIILDRTVFYPEGGGQPGDRGRLCFGSGSEVRIIDTKKSDNGVRHVVAEHESLLPAPGVKITAKIDWDRRYAHMRMHTLLHLLCAVVDGEVTGASVGAEKSRIDFNLPDMSLDKQELTDELNRRIMANNKTAAHWITDEELEAQPALIKTMTVRPPTGQGYVRLMEIQGLDLQPCGGTHVASLAEIGPVRVSKIENKGRQNRRVNVVFGEA